MRLNMRLNMRLKTIVFPPALARTAALLMAAVLVPAAFMSGLAAAERELTIRFESDVFARKGDAVVTQAELDAYMARIPEEHRAGVLAANKRLGKIIDELFLTRLIAGDGIDQGLLDDPAIHAHLYQVAMVYLAEQRTQRIQEQAELDDYTRQARERYMGNPDAYRQNEAFGFSHVLVTTEARSDDQARSLLEDLREKLIAGEEFESLAAEYSEDPSVERNQGRFEDVAPDRLDADFAAALRELSEPGEISPPVKTQFGWHLIRLDRHQPGEVPEFDEIADQLRKQARTNHLDEVRERYIREVMNVPLEIEPGAVDALLERYPPPENSPPENSPPENSPEQP